MPQVHVIGEILGASDVNRKNVFCIWKFVTDTKGNTYWDLLRGDEEGQTQIAYSKVNTVGRTIMR